MFRRYTRREALVLSGQGVLLISGLAAGLAHVSPVRAASTATISSANVPCQAPAHVALAFGFFADEGLQATVVDSGAAAQPALAEGSIDAFIDTPVLIIPPRLASGLSLGDLVMTSALQRGCGSLVATPDGAVQSMLDLQGQTVAGNEFLFGTPLAAAGMDPNVEITWIAAPTSPANVLPALEGGDVVAAQIMHGRGQFMEAAGRARVLVTNNTPPAQNDYCCCCLMSAAATAGDRPKAEAINRALMRAAAWAQAHPAETAALMVERMSAEGVSQEVMQTTLATIEFAPMGESARPILVDQLSRYLAYGLPVRPPADGVTLVDRIFTPIVAEA